MPKQAQVMVQRAMVFIQGLSQKAFQMFHWEVYFQTSVQDPTTYGYVSLFAQGVPELLSAGLLKNPGGLGLGPCL